MREFTHISLSDSNFFIKANSNSPTTSNNSHPCDFKLTQANNWFNKSSENVPLPWLTCLKQFNLDNIHPLSNLQVSVDSTILGFGEKSSCVIGLFYFASQATRAISQKIQSVTHQARAVFSLGNTVFVDPMVSRLQISMNSGLFGTTQLLFCFFI